MLGLKDSDTRTEVVAVMSPVVSVGCGEDVAGAREERWSGWRAGEAMPATAKDWVSRWGVSSCGD